jgi:hypothetical protein
LHFGLFLGETANPAVVVEATEQKLPRRTGVLSISPFPQKKGARKGV